MAVTLPFLHRPVLAKDNKNSFWYRDHHMGEDRRHFAFHVDTYGGAILDLTDEERSDLSIGDFRSRLDETIKYMGIHGLNRGLWLTVEKTNVELIPMLVKEYNFDFHHADRNSVTLSKWLPGDSAPNTLPGPASHTVGVGAVVVRRSPQLEVSQVLLVQEQSGPAARLGVWKFPTGLLDPGEDIATGVLREVKEETGLTEVDFSGILLMRHGHNGAPYLGGNSDLFFLCVLEDRKSQPLQLQVSEIKAAKWVPVTSLLEETKFKSGTSAHLLMETVQQYLERSVLSRNSACLFQEHKRPSWRPTSPHSLFFSSRSSFLF